MNKEELIKKINTGESFTFTFFWGAKEQKGVYNGNYLKFSQNEDLKKYLLDAKDILVEVSPYDKVWGIGIKKEDKNATCPANWPGANKLGFILKNNFTK